MAYISECCHDVDHLVDVGIHHDEAQRHGRNLKDNTMIRFGLKFLMRI